ncbi:MAG: carbohydrate-binding family 9-like protein [Acidobacteria bacterium]|nr:carbohydrate-binding family 9-like protein [Acidobacteriota bacterium]MCA1642640.1 carbohydrate-binding family 9-like protein [Acidobacteriota bacterium]
MNTAEVEALRVEGSLAVGDLDHAAWRRARAVAIRRYWSGEPAPASRHAEARVAWTRDALLARFACPQSEPLIVSAEPRLDEKSLGLWDRDVCEIFVAPTAGEVSRYYEFEVAPTGEWLDLAVDVTGAGLAREWDYRSGMEVAARVEEGALTLALCVPWSAFGCEPRAGERWRANLFRCVGKDPTRGYLAWQPTHAAEPSFHVPEKFGSLRFSP